MFAVKVTMLQAGLFNLELHSEQDEQVQSTEQVYVHPVTPLSL